MVDLEDKHLLQRELLFKDSYGHSAIEHHKTYGDKLQKMLDAKQRNKIGPCSDTGQLVEDVESGRLSVASSVASQHTLETIQTDNNDESETETFVESGQAQANVTPIESFNDGQDKEFDNSDGEGEQNISTTEL